MLLIYLGSNIKNVKPGQLRDAINEALEEGGAVMSTIFQEVLKEGKEYGQGIAYLDDGTMIVIDHAKKLIGKTVSVAVTSVLQTTAGRMIFGQLATKESYR